MTTCYCFLCLTRQDMKSNPKLVRMNGQTVTVISQDETHSVISLRGETYRLSNDSLQPMSSTESEEACV